MKVDNLGRLRKIRNLLKSSISEEEVLVINNKEIKITSATLLIDIFCPYIELVRFLKELKEFKEATFTFLSPDKIFRVASFKINKKEKEIISSE